MMPTTVVNLPDGSTAPINHPEGATEDQILSYAQQEYAAGRIGAGGQDSPNLGAPEYEETAGDYARSVAQGLTFGFGDEIEARVQAARKGTSYEEELARIRGEMKQFEEVNPVAAYGGEFVGSFLMPGGALMGLGKAATKTGAIAKAATKGAASGAAYGAGKSEEELGSAKFYEDVGTSAGYGGAISGGLQSAGQLAVGAGRMIKGVASKADQTNVVSSLKKLDKTAYAQLDKVAEKATPADMQKMGNGILYSLERQGFSPTIHKETASVLKDRIVPLTNNRYSVSQLDDLRSDLYKQANKVGGKDGIYISEIAREVDDMIDLMLQKSPNVSNDAARAARQIHTKRMKVEQLDKALEKATLSGAPTYSSYRKAVNSILNSPQKRFYSDDEIVAMQAFVKPGVGQKIVEQFARFSPGSGSLAGLLQITHVALNPKMAGLSAIAGGASIGASAQTRAAAQDLMNMLGTGEAAKKGARMLPTAPSGLLGAMANQ